MRNSIKGNHCQNRRRGQGATEYLVILGAVLLVSFVVIGATSSVTSSQSSVRQQQSQAYWSSLSPIKVIASKVVDSNLVLQLQNTGSSTIRVDGISVGNSSLPIYPYYSGDSYGPAYCSRPNDNFSDPSMSCALMVGPSESVYLAAQGAISGAGKAIDCFGKNATEVSNIQFAYSTSTSSITNLVLKGDKPLVASCGTKSCDANWVKVPGNSSYLVNDFCVMKYEAKCSRDDGDGTLCGFDLPNSTHARRPWSNISQTDAAERCAALGTGYHLIRDREWVALASAVSGVQSNWFTANIGASSGGQCLFGGHVECDNSPCNMSFNASADDSAGWWNGTVNYTNGTANCPFARNEGRGYETRRTFYLSTGAVVWDLSGNVWEWTDGAVTSSACSDGTMPVNASGLCPSWTEFTNITNYNAFNYSRLPNPNWNQSYGAGRILSNPGSAVPSGSVQAVQRGGAYQNYVNGGVWTLYPYVPPSSIATYRGFRCAR